MTQQHVIEKRIQHITQVIEADQLMPQRRDDYNGQQIGIVINSELTIWGTLPDDSEGDEAFAIELCDKAREEAKKRELQ